MLPPLLYLPAATFCAVGALWAVLQWLYKAAGLRNTKFITHFVGCYDRPSPQSPCFMSLLSAGQVVSSLGAVAAFAVNSYQKTISEPMRWVEVGLGVFLAFHFAVHGLKNEFRLSSLLTVGSAVDVLTVPAMLLLWADSDGEFAKVHWLSLNFLRTLQALLAYEELNRLGAVRLGGEEGGLIHGLFAMGLRFVALVVCFAGSILVLEAIGEMPAAVGADVATPMGNINYFTMIYWIVETITTVGYGDFHPTTFLSRVVTTLLMVTGFAFLGVEMERIFSIMSRQKKFAGSYARTSSKSHVVLVGGGVQYADELLLLAFLEELYHASYRSQWPDLVIMCSEVQSVEQVKEIIETHLEWQARQQIHYLAGSPVNVRDLKRCRCDVAALVFIISDTTGKKEPADEDKENLLRALSLKNTFPNTPMRLMLVNQDSREKAFSVGIPPHVCFAMNEMKNSLFWQSCRCKGWNTLLCNLMVTIQTGDIQADEIEDTPWMNEYVLGMGHEVYGLLPKEEFHGFTLARFIVEAYKRTGICILAVQVEGRIEPAPLRKVLLIGSDTVLFALAQDEEDLIPLALGDERTDWREVFLKNREVAAGRRMSQYLQRVAASEGELHMVTSSSKGTASATRVDFADDQASRAHARHVAVVAGLEEPTLKSLDDLLEEGVPEPLAQRHRQDAATPVPPNQFRSQFPLVNGGVAGQEPPVRLQGLTSPSMSSETMSEMLRAETASGSAPSDGDGPHPKAKAKQRLSWIDEQQAATSVDEVICVPVDLVRLPDEGAGGNRAGGQNTPGDSTGSLPGAVDPHDAESSDGTPQLKSSLSFNHSNGHVSNTYGMHEAISEELLRDMGKRAQRIRSNAVEAPFILVLDQARSWYAIAPFLMQTRSTNLPFEMPVVVLTDKPPPEAVAEPLNFAEDRHLGLVLGSANWMPDLLRAGVLECSIIVPIAPVSLGQSAAGSDVFSRELTAMLDADIVMLQRMLHGIGVIDKAMIFEFKRTQNMRLLPRLEMPGAGGGEGEVEFESKPTAGQEDAVEDRPSTLLQLRSGSREMTRQDSYASSLGSRQDSGGLWTCCCRRRSGRRSQAGDSGDGGQAPRRTPFYLDPRFAAGEIFSPHFLGALLAHAFYTPGIVEVMQALVMPGDEEEDLNIPWQIHVRPQDVGRTYFEVLRDLVEDPNNPTLPLGILRTPEAGGKPYVWTNPTADATLKEADLLYVLGDRDFGEEAHRKGLLPLSGKRNDARRRTLAWNPEPKEGGDEEVEVA